MPVCNCQPVYFYIVCLSVCRLYILTVCFYSLLSLHQILTSPGASRYCSYVEEESSGDFLLLFIYIFSSLLYKRTVQCINVFSLRQCTRRSPRIFYPVSLLVSSLESSCFCRSVRVHPSVCVDTFLRLSFYCVFTMSSQQSVHFKVLN